MQSLLTLVGAIPLTFVGAISLTLVGASLRTSIGAILSGAGGIGSRRRPALVFGHFFIFANTAPVKRAVAQLDVLPKNARVTFLEPFKWTDLRRL